MSQKIDEAMRKAGWLPIAATAKALGVNPTTLYRLIDEEVCEGRRAGRYRYISRKGLLAYYDNAEPVAKLIKAV